MKRKVGFILLKCHDDRELTNYLQRNAEAGWWLSCVKGNRFFFIRRPYEGRRIISYTFSSKEPEVPTEIQLSRYLPELRRRGWDTICLGGPENLVDNRRHAFLYEEKRGAEIPECLDIENSYANRLKSRKVISNLLLCILLEIFLIAALNFDLMRIVSNSGLLIFTLLFFVSITAGLCLSLLSFVSLVQERIKKGSSLSSGQYRLLDHSTRLINIIIIAAIILLLVDGIWGAPTGRGKKVLIGSSTVRIYFDEIPVDLGDLGVEVKGSFRSSRNESSESFLKASYSYCFDEILGTEGKDIYLVSYTLFRCPNRLLRDAVKRQLVDFRAAEDRALASELGVDSALVSSRAKLLVKGDGLLLIRSGFDLSKEQLAILKNLL